MAERHHARGLSMAHSTGSWWGHRSDTTSVCGNDLTRVKTLRSLEFVSHRRRRTRSRSHADHHHLSRNLQRRHRACRIAACQTRLARAQPGGGLGRSCQVLSDDRGRASPWSVSSGQPLRTLHPAQDPIPACHLSDDHRVARGGQRHLSRSCRTVSLPGSVHCVQGTDRRFDATQNPNGDAPAESDPRAG